MLGFIPNIIGNSYQCEFCGKRFLRKENLEDHKTAGSSGNTESGYLGFGGGVKISNKYFCPKCGKEIKEEKDKIEKAKSDILSILSKKPLKKSWKELHKERTGADAGFSYIPGNRDSRVRCLDSCFFVRNRMQEDSNQGSSFLRVQEKRDRNCYYQVKK